MPASQTLGNNEGFLMVGLVGKVFSGKSKPCRKTNYRLQIEALEQRDLLTSMAGLTMDGLTGPSPADAADQRTVDMTNIQGTFTSTSTGTVTGVGGTVGQTDGVLDPGPEPTPAGLALINNLLDTNVRSRALAAYQTDGVISRNDMIDIFFHGSVGYTDLTNVAFGSMNTLVHNARVLGMPEYVEVLAQKVLDQKPLDSLSPAQTLKQSVDNFFLGLNRPQTDIGYSYVQVNKPLFVNGVSAADVDNGFNSGRAGFNWFLSSVAEAASRTPGRIGTMFIDNGDNTYTIRFLHGYYADYVTVDNYLPRLTGSSTGDHYYGAGSSEMWVHLLMKGFVQLNEEHTIYSLQPGVNSYDAIKQRTLSDNTLDPVNPSWLFATLSGNFSPPGYGPFPVTYGDQNGAIRGAWSLGFYVMLKTAPGANELLGGDRWYALVNYVHAPDSTDEWYTVTQDGKRFLQVKGLVLAANFDQFTATYSQQPQMTESPLVGVDLSVAEVVDTAAPAVTDLRLAGPKTGIRSIVLQFNKGLDAASAGNLANYRLTIPGRDGRFGTADDRVIPVRLARYDEASHIVTLTPGKRLRLGQFHQISVSGVTDSAGKTLDQDGDGTADSYVRSFARGKKLSYTEADGDRVFLALARGGMMDLTSGPDGKGAQLRLLGTVKRKSVLKGSVKQTNASSDGVSSLALLSRTPGVNIRPLTAAGSRVHLDVLDVAVLDAALTAALLEGALTAAD